MPPVVHIGPPKTSTKSLQAAVIPHLGRPFQIKPEWCKQLARQDKFDDPRPLAADVVISDEALGDFKSLAPGVIAERLAGVVPDARVIFVRRDPVELFYSVYKERLLTWIAVFPQVYRRVTPPINSADGFFDYQLQFYRAAKTGLFAAMDVAGVAAAFAAFDFRVIDFDAAQYDQAEFTAAFVAACDGTLEVELPRLNEASAEKLEAALAGFSLPLHPDIAARLRDFYSRGRLSPEREEILRSWPESAERALVDLARREAEAPDEDAKRKALAAAQRRIGF